MILLNKQRLD